MFGNVCIINRASMKYGRRNKKQHAQTIHTDRHGVSVSVESVSLVVDSVLPKEGSFGKNMSYP